MNTVVGIGINSTKKISDIIKPFEGFGDVIRASIDARRRQRFDKINIFVQYADKISAKRALEAGYINLDGDKIMVETETSRKRKAEEGEESKDVGRFKIRTKITEIRSKSKEDPAHRKDRQDTNKHDRNRRDRSPAIKSFVRKEYRR